MHPMILEQLVAQHVAELRRDATTRRPHRLWGARAAIAYGFTDRFRRWPGPTNKGECVA
jgi:hypothetical protein